jgi:hypothetical protein
MRTFYTLLVVFCGLVGLESQAKADVCNIAGNEVLNCAFQTGNFAGWTLSGNTNNPGGNYYGVDTFDAYPGPPPSVYGAYLSQDEIDGGENPLNLSQTLATIAGDTYQITFYLMQDTAPVPGYNHSFDATFGATTLLDLLNPATSGVWTEYTFSETATAASTALNFAVVNDDNYWSFDDASVVNTTAAAVPEPAGWLLLLTVCVVCALAVRRSRLLMGQKR